MAAASFIAQMIRDYANNFHKTITNPASIHELSRSTGHQRTGSLSIILFPLINAAIGIAIYHALPSNKNSSSGMLSVLVLIIVLWIAYGTIIHLGHLILRGKGSLREAVPISTQVLSVTYVISNVVALIWVSIIEPNQSGHPTDIATSHTSFFYAPLEAPFLSYFLSQALLLAALLPRALAPVHRIRLARSIAACFLVIPTV